MSETKFTPGPYTFSGWNIWADAMKDPEGNKDGCLAVLCPKPNDAWETVYTGHLLSAATDMYEALEELLFLGLARGCAPDHPRYRAIYKAQAAIHKARGESTEGE